MTEEDKNYRYLIALSIAALGFFAYLVYIKSKENQPTLQPLYKNNYDEKAYSTLENIQYQLQNQQSQINNMGNSKVSNEQIYNLLQNQQSQIDYIMNKTINNQPITKSNSDSIRNLEIPKIETLRNSNFPSSKNASVDKIRQLKYGML